MGRPLIVGRTCNTGGHLIRSEADWVVRPNGQKTCRFCLHESVNNRGLVDRDVHICTDCDRRFDAWAFERHRVGGRCLLDEELRSRGMSRKGGQKWGRFNHSSRSKTVVWRWARERGITVQQSRAIRKWWPTSGPKDLRDARARRGLSVPEAAEIIGVNRNVYTRWEKGDTSPTSHRMVAVWTFVRESPRSATSMIDIERWWARSGPIDLRKVRTRRGLTRDQAAVVMGCTVQALLNWELGYKTPRRKSLRSIWHFVKFRLRV